LQQGWQHHEWKMMSLSYSNLQGSGLTEHSLQVKQSAMQCRGKVQAQIQQYVTTFSRQHG